MNQWKKMPLVRVSLPFILGLFCALELRLSLGVIGVLLVCLAVVLLEIYHSKIKSKRHTYYYAILVSISLFCLGSLRGEIHIKSVKDNKLTEIDLLNAEAYLIQIEGKFTEKAKSFKSKGKIIGVYKEDQLIPHSEATLIYVPKSFISDSLMAADKILALRKPNEIIPPRNPNEFNYKKYLNGLGINYQFYLDSAHCEIIGQSRTKKFIDTFEEIRSNNLNRLKELNISERSFSVISALVFGQKDFLSPELYDAYGSAGATHVLAVSGLHVGLIYVILVWLCKGLQRKKAGRLISLTIILLGLWTYAAITGFSPSVLRASTMFSFISIAQISKKGSNIYNTIAASALCLLVLYPNLLMEVGFQLSYSAVLGILIIQPFLYKLFTPSSWILDKAWQISTVSIAAQLGTFPLGMLYFHQFPNYFIISNLFVIPLATVILYLTLITLIASFIPYVGKILGVVLDSVVWFLNTAIDKMTYLPYARSEGIDISVLECFILYFIIGLFVLIFVKKRYATLKWGLALVVVFFALQCHESYSQHTQSNLTIHSVKGERVFSVVEGKKCYLICSDRLKSDEAKIKFHLSHYWDKLGITEIEHIRTEDFYNCNAFTKTAQSILFKDYLILMSDDFTQESSYKFNQIILIEDAGIKSNTKPKTVYYADGLTKRKYLLSKGENKNVKLLEYALILE